MTALGGHGTLLERAPAKVNLVLRVGERCLDGLHAVCSVFARLDLADELLVQSGGARDAVACPGVEGENLVALALAGFRTAAPHAALPALQVTVAKRIPIAAGLGGGSADAAAILRAANALARRPLPAQELLAVAAGLGSDVPSQLEPRHALVSGTGELVEPLRLPALALVLVPQAQGLSTAAVYGELDRLRARGALAAREALDPGPLRRLAAAEPAELAAALENDLEPPALSLRPELARPMQELLDAGALGARLTGSGPTAFGVFEGREAATAAAASIPGAFVSWAR